LRDAPADALLFKYFECVIGVVNAKIVYKHLKEVFKGRSQARPTDRDMDVGKLWDSLRASALINFFPTTTDAVAAHSECPSVPMCMHVHVKTGNARSRMPHVFHSHKRLIHVFRKENEP